MESLQTSSDVVSLAYYWWDVVVSKFLAALTLPSGGVTIGDRIISLTIPFAKMITFTKHTYRVNTQGHPRSRDIFPSARDKSAYHSTGHEQI